MLDCLLATAQIISIFITDCLVSNHDSRGTVLDLIQSPTVVLTMLFRVSRSDSAFRTLTLLVPTPLESSSCLRTRSILLTVSNNECRLWDQVMPAANSLIGSDWSFDVSLWRQLWLDRSLDWLVFLQWMFKAVFDGRFLLKYVTVPAVKPNRDTTVIKIRRQMTY